MSTGYQLVMDYTAKIKTPMINTFEHLNWWATLTLQITQRNNGYYNNFTFIFIMLLVNIMLIIQTLSLTRILVRQRRTTQICVGQLYPHSVRSWFLAFWYQAIVSTIEYVLWIAPLGTYFDKIRTKLQKLPRKKMAFKMSSAMCLLFSRDFYVLNARCW